MAREVHETEREIGHDSDWNYFYRVKCVGCGAGFKAVRADASFCSSRCKTRYFRAKRAFSQKLDKLDALLVDLSAVMPESLDGDGLVRLQELRDSFNRLVGKLVG